SSIATSLPNARTGASERSKACPALTKQADAVTSVSPFVTRPDRSWLRYEDRAQGRAEERPFGKPSFPIWIVWRRRFAARTIICPQLFGCAGRAARRMTMKLEISAEEARRIALAAQGFG